MVGLVIVSHSSKIAEGIRDLALQMAPEHRGILAAGGLSDGSIGTDATRIMEAIRAADDGDGVAILADLGSGIMSAETALELLEELGEEIPARLADAPVVEGAICAAVDAAAGGDLDSVVAAAEEARGASKLE